MPYLGFPHLEITNQITEIISSWVLVIKNTAVRAGLQPRAIPRLILVTERDSTKLTKVEIY